MKIQFTDWPELNRSNKNKNISKNEFPGLKRICMIVEPGLTVISNFGAI